MVGRSIDVDRKCIHYRILSVEFKQFSVAPRANFRIKFENIIRLVRTIIIRGHFVDQN